MRTYGMVQWKYKTLPFTSRALDVEFLDELGLAGWELVSMQPLLVFKKPEQIFEREGLTKTSGIRPGLLRTREAAEYLGMSRTMLYCLTASGQIPVAEIGKSVRIPAQVIDEWIERQIRHFG